MKRLFFLCSILFSVCATAQVISSGKTVTVSSTYPGYPAANVVDGNWTTTRWASEAGDPQWLQVDLGDNADVTRIKIVWEAAYGRSFTLEISDDAVTWRNLQTIGGNSATVGDYTVTGSGRYVRWTGTERVYQEYGYSMWEFEVYGTFVAPPPPPPPVYTFAGYKCRPGYKDGEIRPAKQGDDMIELWFCDMPDGIYPQYFCHSLSRTPDGVVAYAIALIRGLTPSRACTTSEIALAERTLREVGVQITVATNGSSDDRPVYSRKADNTIDVAVTRIAVDKPERRSFCGWKRLQNASGAATNYFEVPTMPGFYTYCKVTGVTSK